MGGGPSPTGSRAVGVGLRAVSGIGLESQGGTAHGWLTRGAELDRPDAGPCPAQPPNFTSGETEVTDWKYCSSQISGDLTPRSFCLGSAFFKGFL